MKEIRVRWEGMGPGLNGIRGEKKTEPGESRCPDAGNLGFDD